MVPVLLDQNHLNIPVLQLKRQGPVPRSRSTGCLQLLCGRGRATTLALVDAQRDQVIRRHLCALFLHVHTGGQSRRLHKIVVDGYLAGDAPCPHSLMIFVSSVLAGTV
jgi:hypothetical protein